MKEQRSLRGKVWEYRTSNDEVRGSIEEERRAGIDARVWLSPTFSDLTDPLLMKDLTIARDRIKSAIEAQERIMVFGDFDADGITATAALVHGLKNLGAEVSYRIPDRITDSHGLKVAHVDEMVVAGTILIITVDCGVNDREAVAHAHHLGVEVIITDHHQVDPARVAEAAVAICNPTQPDCLYPAPNLAGVGVVFKLLQALNPDEKWLQPYLALVAIGTVADCIKLTGESRMLVQLGLKALNQNFWPGLDMLLESDDPITEETIGFQIAPRLNAASRLGEVQPAVQLFLGAAERMPQRVAYLQQLNQQRQEFTKTFTAKAQSLIQPTATAQVLFLEACPLGILGLVASKLVEQTHQPVLCLARHPHGGLHGSARGLPGAGLSDVLQAGSTHLASFGGHDGAAGFRLEEADLADFTHHVQAWYASHPLPIPTLQIAADMNPAALNLEHLSWQQTLAPFGMGNPLPVWQVSALKLVDLNPIGRDQNHARITFAGGYEAVAFFAVDLLEMLEIGQSYDLALTLHQNSWNGETKCQWQVVDVRSIIN